MLMALSTVVGVATVLPFFAVLADPQSIRPEPCAGLAVQRPWLHRESSFVVALGLVSSPPYFFRTASTCLALQP